MVWFSIPPSAPWQWVALFAGIIALGLALMALPTVFQMIWGRPRMAIDYNIRELEGGRVLQCTIQNIPIRNKILRTLGVRRMPAEDIMAGFQIKECNTQQIVFPLVVTKIIAHDGTTGAHRISLAGSRIPAVFGIVVAEDDIGEVRNVEEQASTAALRPSKYCACAHIAIEGKDFDIERNFVVMENHPFICLE